MPPPTICVHLSADGADIAAPISLMEWFLNFYDTARRGGDDSGDEDDASAAAPSGSAVPSAHGAASLCNAAVAVHRGRGAGRVGKRVRPLECIVRAGELIYVPRGWGARMSLRGDQPPPLCLGCS